MKISPFFIAALLAASFLGCRPFDISVHEQLKANADHYAVKGRHGILINQKLNFGEYNTTKVKRSWIRSTSSTETKGWVRTETDGWIGMISTEYINKNQTLNFGLTDAQRHSEVYCVNNFNAEDLHIGENPNSILNIGLDIFGEGVHSDNMYYAQIFIAQEERPWELVLDIQEWQRDPNRYRGYLVKSKDEYYTLVPLTKLEKTTKDGHLKSSQQLFGSSGFEIHNQKGEAVAAVSTINRGKIFLGKTTAEERFLLANLCTALLLQPTYE